MKCWNKNVYFCPTNLWCLQHPPSRLCHLCSPDLRRRSTPAPDTPCSGGSGVWWCRPVRWCSSPHLSGPSSLGDRRIALWPTHTGHWHTWTLWHCSPRQLHRGVGGKGHKRCPIQTEQINTASRFEFPVQWQRTTVCLITAVPTVPLPVTEEAVRKAAALVVTLVTTAIHALGASLFIRVVLTLRHTVTHLALFYALLSMGTLELVCRGHMAWSGCWQDWAYNWASNCVFPALEGFTVLPKYLYIY